MDAIRTIDWLWGDGEQILWGDDEVVIMRYEVTDVAFLQWLRDIESRVTLLAEVAFGYQSAGSPAEGTIYLADRPYCSEDTQPYEAVIDGLPTMERALDVRALGGRGSASLGSLMIANADGRHDYLLERIMDGRDVAFLLGDPTWERSQFRQIGKGVVAAVRADDDARLTLTLRDRNLLLDATIIGDEMASGPNEGKPKPVIFGQVYNFDLSPYLYDQTGPSYYFNNYAQDSSLAFQNILVRDAGVSLVNAGFSGTNAAITANATTNTITKTAHGLLENDVIRFSGTDPFQGLSQGVQYWVIASGLTADDFKVSLTRGGSAVDITGTTFSGTLAVSSRRYYVDAAAASITLSAEPEGRVTADILAQGTSGDAAIQDVPHAAFRYILDTWTRTTSADRDTAAFTALVASEQSAGTRWGIAILDRTNVLDVLDKIAVATNSWYGWDRDGLLSVGKLDLANLDGETPSDTIVADDMLGDPACENLALQFGRLIVDANRNVVTQTDGLATSVSAENRSKWAQPSQTRVKATDADGEQYLVDWWTYHKSAIDSAPLETAFVGTESVVQAYCDERTELFAPWTRVLTCTVRLDKWQLDLGDCVEVTYPRYGLSGGVNFRVASVRVRPGDKAVDLTLVRQTIPAWDALGVGLTAPGAPTIGTATAGNLKATVTFTAPVSNGGAAITSYRVTSTPGSITADGSASPIVVTGLSNGTGYTFKVKALNSEGYGDESAASNSATPASTVPDAPTSAAATVASTTSVSVAFTAPSDNGGSAITGYTVTSSPGSLTGTGASSPITVSGLTSGTTYTFTVHATNANGNSAESSASNAVTPGGRQISLAISSNTANYNIFAAAGYPTDDVDVTLTITADVYSATDGGLALDTGSGWTADSTIRIVVGTVSTAGYVIGRGGAGGSGSTGAAGSPGMPGITLRKNTTVDITYGYIHGGGGGGGGGGPIAPAGEVGGDGGGGAGYGTSGTPGGAGGGRETGENAGLGYFSPVIGTTGDGGNGGAPGSAGSGGTAASGINGFPSTAGGSGGAAGKAINTNGYTVTWIGYDAARVKGAVG